MFIRPVINCLKRITNSSNVILVKGYTNQTNKYSTYGASKPEGDPSLYTEYEIVKNSESWKYVERYLPKPLIPEPLEKSEYPSGWKPASLNPEDSHYFVERTKNHLVPVYLQVTHRGQSRITFLRKISGDIWSLKQELLEYLERLNKRPIGIRVDEIAGIIKFRGDHVVDIQNWLYSKGF